MSERRIPNDATRVDVNHDDEVRYWCEAFGCTPEQLREAVSAAGQDVDNVRQHLSQPTV
jgi:hypothetical protein